MDVLQLLSDQSAQNRANFAQAQADRSEVAAAKPKQWTAQGRDADSGRMALAADGDEPKLIGDRITSGNIQPGQAVRVNGDGRTVTVDQKPSKQRQVEAAIVPATVQPYWVAFGTGFAVSFDADAKTFTETQQYPEYDEYAAVAQGKVMFPYGRISCFAAASLDLWVVGGFLDYDRFNPPPPQSLRLSLAASSDQGATWQLCEQFVPTNGSDLANWVYSLVWGAGYFFAIVALTQVWRSEDGVVWEQISNVPPFQGYSFFVQDTARSLAVWNDAVYLIQSRTGLSDEQYPILTATSLYAYSEDGQGKPEFTLAKQISLNATSQYGAYNAYGNPVHLYDPGHDQNLLTLPISLYPFLLSSGDLNAISDYGDAVYDPDPVTYLSLLSQGVNQTQAIAHASNIDGQVFLMLSQRWGFRNDDKAFPFGFAAIHEGASWRTCEHPFLNTLPNEGNHDSTVQSVTYSSTLQSWLVYEAGSHLSIGGLNGDAWNEPFLPELSTAIERSSPTLSAIANQVTAFQVAGNYVS